MSPRFRLSVVVPCFNEEASLPALRRRLESWALYVLGAVEVVPVDDGSSDGTWPFLARWAFEDERVRAVRLKGNQGNQRAMLAGLAQASAPALAVMDADLQDPPELLGEMLEDVERGAAAAVGVKTRREDGAAWLSALKDLAAAGLPFRRGEGDYCVLSRKAAEAMLSLGPEDAPFRVRRHWACAGSPVLYRPYRRDAREAGESKFDLLKLARLWLRLVGALLRGPRRLESPVEVPVEETALKDG